MASAADASSRDSIRGNPHGGAAPPADESDAQRTLWALDRGRQTTEEIAAFLSTSADSALRTLQVLESSGSVESWEEGTEAREETRPTGAPAQRWTFWQLTWRGRFALHERLMIAAGVVAIGFALSTTATVAWIADPNPTPLAAGIDGTAAAAGLAATVVGAWWRRRPQTEPRG